MEHTAVREREATGPSRKLPPRPPPPPLHYLVVGQDDLPVRVGRHGRSVFRAHRGRESAHPSPPSVRLWPGSPPQRWHAERKRGDRKPGNGSAASSSTSSFSSPCPSQPDPSHRPYAAPVAPFACHAVAPDDALRPSHDPRTGVYTTTRHRERGLPSAAFAAAPPCVRPLCACLLWNFSHTSHN